jgi:hypothetical protein
MRDEDLKAFKRATAAALRKQADLYDPPASFGMPECGVGLQDAFARIEAMSEGKSFSINMTIWHHPMHVEIPKTEVSFGGSHHPREGYCDTFGSPTLAGLVDEFAKVLTPPAPLTVEQAGELVEAACSPPF